MHGSRVSTRLHRNGFWLRSMTGEEIARVYAWSNDPLGKGDYEAASPCQMCDLPQNRFEPILGSEAARLRSYVRFSMESLSFQHDEHGVTALVRDRVAGDNIETRGGYMIGADGARSREAGPLVSTVDVAGKQRFTVITAVGGDRWREAAALVSERTGVPIAVVSIAPFLDYEDPYGRWSDLADIEESGCVLVRPDLYIYWRCTAMPADPVLELSATMRALVGFEPSSLEA
jgi:2-polyprenyl-6-methoxyphenol hydroxylase-like FAD-dependent oxidoreductase